MNTENNTELQLSDNDRNYLKQLAFEIAKTGKTITPENIVGLIKDAHEKRKQFTEEMIEQKTPRSKMAAKAIATKMWLDANQDKAISSLLFDCYQINGDNQQ